MTIKELEQAVGMTRANIRFYEQEGLLSPARGENGYRDYSPADVETLERIKLLRQLHLSLEEIRALQRGTLALPDALQEQLRKLEADQTALDRAREVCAKLRAAGTDYAALDARPWLSELEREPAPESERFAPPADVLPPLAGHPWRRFFARSLDLAFYGILFTLLWTVVLHIPIDLRSNRLFQVFDRYLALVVMLLVEPVLLHFWGTTPGKWVFGITLRDADGEKFSLRTARERTWLVFTKGMGWGLPFYELYRNWKSWRTVAENDRCEWEYAGFRAERMDIPDSGGRCLAYVGAMAAVYGVTILLTLQSLMPPCRGELSLSGFCRNINFYSDYLSVGLLPFNEEGLRDETSSGTTVIHIGGAPDEAWSPIEENGETVGFRYTLHTEGTFFFNSFTTQQLGVMAFVGALPETNCVSFALDGWDDVLKDLSWEFDLVHRGLRLTQTVAIQGERPTEDWIVAGQDEGPVTLDLEFTIRRT